MPIANALAGISGATCTGHARVMATGADGAWAGAAGAGVATAGASALGFSVAAITGAGVGSTTGCGVTGLGCCITILRVMVFCTIGFCLTISFGGGGGGGGASGLGISTCMMTSGGAGATCAIAAITPREPNKTASIRKPPKSDRAQEVGGVVSASRVAHKAPGRTSVVALILYGLSDRLFAARCQRHRCDTGSPYNIHCFHNFLI